MKKYSLTKALIPASWSAEGLIESNDNSLWKAFELEPHSIGLFEESCDGPLADGFFQKLGDLLTRLPDYFEGQLVLVRNQDDGGQKFRTRLLAFEKVKRAEAYSHLNAILQELKLQPHPLSVTTWSTFQSTIFGPQILKNKLPDLLWDRDSVKTGDHFIRMMSLTELPQVTWKACLQPIFETQMPFAVSIRLGVPERKKIRRQLETKRRISHALSVTTSLEVRNIESNSVLHSSEETLERILVGKETLFEISVGLILAGSDAVTLERANDLERMISGIGNAGLYLEGVGCLPVLASHLPGGKTMAVRKLPILSQNLAHSLPFLLDYSRSNDESTLSLQSRCGEASNLNLFSKENLNFNSFICGASGSGKSFLMNAILSSTMTDQAQTRLCIFDIGGSYRRVVEKHNGRSHALTISEANTLLATYIKNSPVDGTGFYRSLIETLCGSGSHITHSHRVAIDDLLRDFEGRCLNINQLTKAASKKPEAFYQDIAHWLKPHLSMDDMNPRQDLYELIRSQVSAFDFKDLDSDPVLQRTTILLLSHLLWKDLTAGKYPRTLIIFDEVWRFFAQSRSFLEEMYRTLRKYRAGIVSITQNLADYGDEAFAKMIFTNSFTKIFLQNGAAAEFLKQTFDLPDSDIGRALSVASKKPIYSEFFVLSPTMSQIFRLYPTSEFYALANTENISQPKENQ